MERRRKQRSERNRRRTQRRCWSAASVPCLARHLAIELRRFHGRTRPRRVHPPTPQPSISSLTQLQRTRNNTPIHAPPAPLSQRKNNSPPPLHPPKHPLPLLQPLRPPPPRRNRPPARPPPKPQRPPPHRPGPPRGPRLPHLHARRLHQRPNDL